MNKTQNYVLYVLFFIFTIVWTIVILSPISKEPELVYTKDGCSTYRFYDKGTRHYYTNCEKSNE